MSELHDFEFSPEPHSGVNWFAPQTHLDLPDKFIRRISPEIAGELSVLLLGLSARLMRHVKEQDKWKDYEKQHRRTGTLMGQIECAALAVPKTMQVMAMTIKEAVEHVARGHNLPSSTVAAGLRNTPLAQQRAQRIQIDRLLEADWPVPRIAEYLGLHRSTVTRRRKQWLLLERTVSRHAEGGDTEDDTDGQERI